jgi:hypothetical protein
MFRVRPDGPSTPDFHPEFGILCPSSRRRRRLRLILTCVMAIMAFEATAKLGVAGWRDSVSRVTVPTAGPIGDQSPGEAVAPGLSEFAAFPSMTTSDTDRSKRLSAESFCKNLSTSFLDPTCRSEKPRARHAARAAYRVATVIIGRSPSPPPPVVASDPAPASATPIDQRHAVAAGTNKTTALMAQSVDRPVRPAKNPKAAPSAPTVLDAEPKQEDVGINAYAATPPRPGHDYHARPDDPFRAAALPQNYRGPFGMFW